MDGDERLRAVRDELDAALAERIGQLMGIVRASRELVDQIGDADRQIAAEQARIDGGSPGDSESAELNLQVVRAVREELVARLADIAANAR